jgi:hypothetical protein
MSKKMNLHFAIGAVLVSLSSITAQAQVLENAEVSDIQTDVDCLYAFI